MKDHFYGMFFKINRWLIRRIYPKYSTQIPNHTNNPIVYISHHQNLFGPFILLLWFPMHLHAWILHVFLNQKTCYQQFVQYTFTERFKQNRIFAKLCAFPISYAISKLLNSGKGIPVYRGSRKIIQTFNQTVDALCKGESIAIFPDINYSDVSAETKEMYDGFLYLEKYYFKGTGKHICFMPLFVSKNKKLILADSEIYFRDGEDFNSERKIVYEQIHCNLNQLAKKCGDL